MNRITTLLALAALMLPGFIASAPAHAAATAQKQTQACTKCATGKAGASKTAGTVKIAALHTSEGASCCTSRSCCPECPSCCTNGTCNTGKCPSGCCDMAACQPGAACCR